MNLRSAAFSAALTALGAALVALPLRGLVLGSASASALVPTPFPTLAPAARVPEHGLSTAVFAGGCFWGMEAVFEKLRGVRAVEAGYSGGAAATAHYEMVSTGLTGHAESVRITYDPKVIDYATLLRVDLSVAHDPTELDRQGPDSGSQYRSVVFYGDDAQRRTARAYLDDLGARHVFSAPIVTQLVPLEHFYPAEAYHQHYADRNPDDGYIVAVDEPKIHDLRQRYPQLLTR